MPLLNLRDVAVDTSLRPGLLYRSAQPHRLTTADTDLVCGLRLIVDLRGERERAAGDWAPALDAGVRLALLGTDSTGSPADLAALPDGIDLGGLYVLMLEHRAAWFAGVIAEIADGLPALVHCAAGKDRTGVVVALILDLLGVDHEAIVRDYTRTATALPGVMAMLGMSRDTVPSFVMEAPDSAMRTFLAALADRGGAETVLLAAGLTPAHVVRLAKPLCE